MTPLLASQCLREVKQHKYTGAYMGIIKFYCTTESGTKLRHKKRLNCCLMIKGFTTLSSAVCLIQHTQNPCIFSFLSSHLFPSSLALSPIYFSSALSSLQISLQPFLSCFLLFILSSVLLASSPGFIRPVANLNRQIVQCAKRKTIIHDV